MDTNEQTILELRAALEREVNKAQVWAERDDAQLNEISRINNELVNTQRELTSAAKAARQGTHNLKVSEERYRRLFEAAKDGILILNAETGQIEDVNPFLCQLLGIAPDDFIGKQLWEIGTFRDIATNQDALHTLQAKEYVRYDDLPLETKDGQSISVEFVSNVYVSGDKKVIQCNIRDISGRKSAEAVSTRMASIVETSDDAIITKTLDGIITSWNAGAQKLYGYTAQEAIGRSVSFLAPSNLHDEMPKLLEKVRRGEPVKHYETERVDKDGLRKYISLSISPLKDSQGHIVGVSSIKRDITERKQAEALLHNERDFIAAVIDTVGNLVVVLDRQGRIVRFNHACEHLTGYSFEEVKGRNFQDLLLAPEEAVTVKLAFTQLCAGQFPNAHENFWVARDGRRRLIAWSNTALLDAQGEVAYLIGTGTDITERKQAEAEEERLHAQIVEQRQRLNTIVANVPGVVWESWGEPDASQQRIDFVSDYVETMLGYSVEEWSGTSNFWLTIVHPEDKERAERESAAFFASGRGGTSQFRWITRDGRVVWGESHMRLISNEAGHPVGLRGVTLDITERKQAEKQVSVQAHLLNEVGQAVIATDMQGTVLYWNRYAEALYGWAEQETIGRNVNSLVVPESGQVQANEIMAMLNRGERWFGEFLLLHRDGTSFPAEVMNTPLYDEAGALGGIIGISQDITERKKATEALEARTREIVTIWESMSDAFFSLDAGWRFTYVNSNAALLWQRNAEELIGTNIWEELPGVIDTPVETELHRAVQEQVAVDFEAWNPVNNAWREARAYPSPVGLSVYFRDITERKQAEAALKVSESRYHSLFENMLEGYAYCRTLFEGEQLRDFVYLEVNSALEKLTGLKDVAGKKVSEAIPGLYEASPEIFEMYGRVALTGKPEKCEIYLEPLGIWLSIAAYSSQREHFVAVFDNITERKQTEETLLHSEERYRSLALATSQIVWTVSADGVVGEMPAWNDITGQSLKEARNWGWAEAIHPNDRERTAQLWADSIETKSLYATEYRVRAADGSYRLFMLRGIPILESDGSVREWVGTMTDITELRKAEADLHKANEELELRVSERTVELERANVALREEEIEQQQIMATLTQSEERFRLLVESVHDYSILMLDATGHIMTWNAGAERMKGYGAEEIIGQHFSCFYTDEDQQAGKPELELRRAETEGYLDDEGWRVRQDGSRFWSTTVITALRDEFGKLRGFAKITRDITERKQIEEELQRSREELQSFIDAMSTLAAKVAPDGRFLIINKIALDASGLSYDDYQNANFLEGPWWTFDSTVQTRVREMFRQALSGTPINYDENIFVFGQVRTINFSLIPIHDAGGQVEYLIAEGRDITVLKQTEEALQLAKTQADAANLAKSEFLSRMSHELRTPLNAILGFGQILEMDVDMPPRRRENVQHILKGGRHLLELINEILDISRIEAGHLSLSLEPVPVDLTVREVLDLVRPLTAAGNVQLINEIPPHSDWYMLADQQRLNQVLLNLISNAIKYNRDGGSVTVLGEEVSGEAISGQAWQHRGVLRLSIRDTGNGLGEEDIARLFVPFERLGAAKTRIEGTGIGLALSKRLVEAMGGQIGVWSTPGQGSTFWIELPLVPSPLQIALEHPETPTLQTVMAPDGRRKTVLYIEDNLANLQLIEMLLESRPDVRLLTAMQGSTGLDLAFEHSPDLILLDLDLPDFNGDEVLRRLRADDRTGSTPVVIISADATPGQIERLLAAGAKIYLTKPLNVKEFLNVLDESLKGKE